MYPIKSQHSIVPSFPEGFGSKKVVKKGTQYSSYTRHFKFALRQLIFPSFVDI